MVRLGIVDFDTSHCVEFTKRLNHKNIAEDLWVDGARVVLGWTGPSAITHPESIRGYQKTLTDELGVELVENPQDMIGQVDGVDAILLMCSPPENMSAGLRILKAVFKGAVGAYPNIGYRPVAPLGAGEEAEDEEADFLQTGSYPPARLAGFAREWKDLGARIFGGCCATGPEHVQAMRRVVKG